MPRADLCVIFNPAAGRRRALGRLERLRRAWGSGIDIMPTGAPGHAEELALQMANSGYRIVAAAGGDGTVHEVANGILRAARPEVCFGVVPIGSANDYAHSLEYAGRGAGRDPAGPDNGILTVDVGRVRAPAKPPNAGRQRYFVCCLGLGLNGAVTLESRRIRRLQGLALYGLATLRALWYHFACPGMELTIDGQHLGCLPTLMLSVLLGRREGGFVLAPEAKLDDGWMEFVHAGELSRFEVLRYLPRLALFGPPHGHPKLRLGRCRTINLRSQSPLTVHVDGEFFCRPEDNVRELEIEVLPASLKVNLEFLKG